MLTEAEKRLCDLMWEIAPNDKDFQLLIVLSCRVYNLTERLVEYIETNHITDWHDVEDWYGDWLDGEGRLVLPKIVIEKPKVREAMTGMRARHAARKNLRVINHRQKHSKS